jgi:predicted transcriptional regulator
MRVLGLLDAEEASTVAEVRSRLSRRGHELAYTTVLTVLARLHDKGVVKRRKEGKRLLYWSARGAGRVKRDIVGRVQRALFDDDRLRPIAALIASEHLSQDELRELRELIDARLGDEDDR